MGLQSYHVTETGLTSINLKPPFPKGKCISYLFQSASTDDNVYAHLSATG